MDRVIKCYNGTSRIKGLVSVNVVYRKLSIHGQQNCIVGSYRFAVTLKLKKIQLFPLRTAVGSLSVDKIC